MAAPRVIARVPGMPATQLEPRRNTNQSKMRNDQTASGLTPAAPRPRPWWPRGLHPRWVCSASRAPAPCYYLSLSRKAYFFRVSEYTLSSEKYMMKRARSVPACLSHLWELATRLGERAAPCFSLTASWSSMRSWMMLRTMRSVLIWVSSVKATKVSLLRLSRSSLMLNFSTSSVSCAWLSAVNFFWSPCTSSKASFTAARASWASGVAMASLLISTFPASRAVSARSYPGFLVTAQRTPKVPTPTPPPAPRASRRVRPPNSFWLCMPVSLPGGGGTESAPTLSTRPWRSNCVSSFL
mmetsp:Transcript_117641/g.333412  ORF Transcript_117641/g.333412 Transcript_117641/m.333412 type:complete len:297 (-) Transcript_117641:256-1146(-)